MKEIKAIDIELSEGVKGKTAYFRLDDSLYKFLKLCSEKETIIGFEYDGSRNFGVILKN